MKENTLHVLSHTHWDREWYQPFQAYRQRLVYQMDSLLDLMDARPEFKYFHTDGQTSLLHDYLDIRPENRERLAERIKEGRIVTGPWFVMPDEFLLSGESMVRNLLMGHADCKNFGGEPMPCGYVTDIFVHCSQLPQILSGFGIESSMLFRGTSGDNEKSEMVWEAPDGSKVLLIRNTPEHCYADFVFREWNENTDYAAYEKLKLGYANTPVLFGLDGSDHHPPRWNMPEEIDFANEQFKSINCIHSSFGEYLKSLLEAMGNWRENDKLKKFVGELRYPAKFGKWAGISQGIGSGRVYIKQANDAQEWRLTRKAEPLHVWSLLLGGDCQKAFLDKSWKYLILNHPHDSIVGCSVDQVHRDMVYRFDQARMLADNSISESIQHINNRVDTSAFEPCERAVTVFNLSTKKSGPVSRLYFEIPSSLLKQKAEEGLVPVLKNADGTVQPYQLIKIEPNVRMENFTWKLRVPYPYYTAAYSPDAQVHRLHALAECEITAMGYKVFGIDFAKPIEDKKPAARIKTNKTEFIMENEFLHIKLNANGTIDLHDKEHGLNYFGLNALENCGDAGNGWNHHHPKNDRVIFSTDENAVKNSSRKFNQNGHLYAEMVFSFEMTVPENLIEDRSARSENTVRLPIKITFSLASGERMVRCRMDAKNNAMCHRFRAMFPMPNHISTDHWHADTPYDFVRRSAKLLDTTGYKQHDREETPIKNFAVACGEKSGFAVFTKGLNEAAMQDNENHNLALTLYRGFYQYLEYEGTHDSQILGDISVEYAFGTFSKADGVVQPSQIFYDAEQYKIPTTAITQNIHSAALPCEGKLIEIDEPMVLQALKTTEDGTGIIVRVFNPTKKDECAGVKFFYGHGQIWHSNMKEDLVRLLQCEPHGKTFFNVRSKGVETVVFKF
ncbi:MAG: hypothetical protein FWE82_01545 [Defluviitaleaceae bacterium]|nr:hypothetical protein [Defluviitaleaceae bacterium]